MLGPIEVVVSNAGDVQPISTTGADPEEFARQLQVNLAGAQALVSRLVPPMMQRGRGDVVFVTSEVAVRPRPEMAGYVASKAGLEAFAEAMAMECEGTGVRVGIARPGPCPSGAQRTSGAEAQRSLPNSPSGLGSMARSGTRKEGRQP